MRKIVSVIEELPVWYGLGVVLLYSLLYAEFLTAFLKLFPYEEVLNDIFKTILGVSYVAAILSGFIMWMIYTLLFHLMAMLFGGQLSFKRFLFATAYPYLIPACVVFAGIILLDSVQPLNLGDTEDLLMQNSTVQLATNLLKYSVAPYYLIVAVFIRYIYQIKYIYAALSVAIPIASIWLITELFKLI
jgi:hypothetical protein